MANDITVRKIEHNGVVVAERGSMMSLTDMWKAAESPSGRAPADWLALVSTKEFTACVAATLEAGNSGIQTKRGGRGIGGSTFAHWQIGLAYAKYLDPVFHMKCNQIVRERMEGRSVSVATLPPEVLEMIRRDDGISRMLSHKVTGIEATVQTLATAVAAIATAMRPPADGIYVTGRTAGEIWKAAGFPPIKITSWFSNRLAKMECQVDGCRRSPVGTSRAKLFDQDKAENWLRNGGRKLVEEYVAKRMNKGQVVMRLVQPAPPVTEQPSA